MPGPHKGVSTQRTNQQVLVKPRHQPSERYQQARERLRQKAKINSCAYMSCISKTACFLVNYAPLSFHLDGMRNRKARTGLVHRSAIIELHPQNQTRPHFGT